MEHEQGHAGGLPHAYRDRNVPSKLLNYNVMTQTGALPRGADPHSTRQLTHGQITAIHNNIQAGNVNLNSPVRHPSLTRVILQTVLLPGWNPPRSTLRR